MATRDAAPRRQHLGDRARRGGLSVPLPPRRGRAADRPPRPPERAHRRRLARARARRGAVVRRAAPKAATSSRTGATPPRASSPSRPAARPISSSTPTPASSEPASACPRATASGRSSASPTPSTTTRASGPRRLLREVRQVTFAADVTWPSHRSGRRGAGFVSTTVEPCGAPTSSRSRSPLRRPCSGTRPGRGRWPAGSALLVLAGIAVRARSAQYIVVWAVAPLLFWATYPDPSGSLAAVALAGCAICGC